MRKCKNNVLVLSQYDNILHSCATNKVTNHHHQTPYSLWSFLINILEYDKTNTGLMVDPIVTAIITFSWLTHYSIYDAFHNDNYSPKYYNIAYFPAAIVLASFESIPRIHPSPISGEFYGSLSEVTAGSEGRPCVRGWGQRSGGGRRAGHRSAGACGAITEGEREGEGEGEWWKRNGTLHRTMECRRLNERNVLVANQCRVPVLLWRFYVALCGSVLYRDCIVGGRRSRTRE